MKKLLLLLVPIMLVISCQKERTIPDTPSIAVKHTIEQSELIMKNKLKVLIFDSVRTELYHHILFDTCSNENIILDGLETYSTIESHDGENYFILYQIDFTDVVGVGEISGTIYHGGGRSRDVSRLTVTYPPDGTASNKTIARSIYRLDYKSDHHEFIFSATNRYREINGIAIIDDTGNPILETCRDF